VVKFTSTGVEQRLQLLIATEIPSKTRGFTRFQVLSVQPSYNSTYFSYRFAKMFYKGVSFTSDTSALVYLVDQAGTRTTTDNFSDMHGDFSIPVFLEEAYYGYHAIKEATSILRSSQYWVTEDGVENWVINGVRVSQTPDGLVRYIYTFTFKCNVHTTTKVVYSCFILNRRVGRGTSKYQIRTSPLNGTATLTTPFVHSTASMGLPTPNGSGGPHLFVKRGG